MRLCLDEHSSPRIAAELRARGHDAISVQPPRPPGAARRAAARRDDRGPAGARDRERQGLRPLAGRLALEGRAHLRLILTSSAALPRSRNTVGRFVTALHALLAERPADDALRDQIAWLKPRD
jgi:hypothetical protein